MYLLQNQCAFHTLFISSIGTPFVSGMKKVKNMVTDTLMACPADRISKGQISLGTNHPSGPHDHANAATYPQIRNNTRLASWLVRVPTPLTPNFSPIISPTPIWQMII